MLRRPEGRHRQTIPPRGTGGSAVRYLSDVNLRAVLAVLVSRAGGTVEIANAELYDAMLPDQGRTETFVVEEIAGGLRLSLVSRDAKTDRD